MKSASRLSLSVIVFAGACVATFSGWTAETPTDRLPDTSKPGTAQRPGKVDKDSTKNQGMESTGTSKDRSGTSDSSARSSSTGGQYDVKTVQEALKEKGFDPGPADGVMGQKTREALRSFQQSKNIKATRRIDAETAQQLGLQQGSRGSMDKSGGSSSSGMKSSGSSGTPSGGSSTSGTGSGNNSSKTNR